MFGAVTTYLFEYILGIKQCKDSCGFDRITISPAYVDGLDYVKGHITTVKGIISVSYKKTNGKVTIYLDIPDGVHADVTTPLGYRVEVNKATKARFV
jgi:alpha-L-rhamnosidase